MEIKRKRFQGVVNILSFNRHYYVFGVIALALIISSKLIFNWSNTLFYLFLLTFIYGLSMPLFISAYVYDFSGFYNFDWLKKMNIEDSTEKFNLNINAGFDETSYIIKNILPQSKLQAFDFYNSKKHTESAIVRARKVSLVFPNTQHINSKSIPLSDNSVDTIFLLSAVHEIRENNERLQFLKECRRVCKPNGNVIMVEHLRDIPNFIAFTIGFTHFFSKNTWKKGFEDAGFTSFKEIKFTPFISIFNCQ